GEDRFASGVIVLTPMELEVTTSDTGRIRIAVRDARTRRGVPGARVKVVGSQDAMVQLGETDLRGGFVAEPVAGRLTCIARSGANRYAIHRSPPVDDLAESRQSRRGRETAGAESKSDDDLDALSRQGRERQIQRLQKRGDGGMSGGLGGMMGGGFR